METYSSPEIDTDTDSSDGAVCLLGLIKAVQTSEVQIRDVLPQLIAHTLDVNKEKMTCELVCQQCPVTVEMEIPQRGAPDFGATIHGLEECKESTARNWAIQHFTD